MTPCEERGWKVGDRFVVAQRNGHKFDKGSKIVLTLDDGTNMPRFSCSNGLEQWVFLTDVEPLSCATKSPFHKLAKAANSAKKLDKELAKINAQLPDGFAIVRKSSEPAEDMSDWRNWKSGDLVECVEPASLWFEAGKKYTVGTDSHGDFGVKDMGGDVLDCSTLNSPGFRHECFKFHSRPVQP